MAKLSMALAELVEKGAQDDVVRELLGLVAERLMEFEIEQRTGAEYGARSADRANSRNGYRDRLWETRAGSIDLRVPKLFGRCDNSRRRKYRWRKGNPGHRRWPNEAEPFWTDFLRSRAAVYAASSLSSATRTSVSKLQSPRCSRRRGSDAACTLFATRWRSPARVNDRLCSH